MKKRLSILIIPPGTAGKRYVFVVNDAPLPLTVFWDEHIGYAQVISREEINWFVLYMKQCWKITQNSCLDKTSCWKCADLKVKSTHFIIQLNGRKNLTVNILLIYEANIFIWLFILLYFFKSITQRKNNKRTFLLLTDSCHFLDLKIEFKIDKKEFKINCQQKVGWNMACGK